jgi:outer membrane protein OmpA-like peptidoglycan-associated protein
MPTFRARKLPESRPSRAPAEQPAGSHSVPHRVAERPSLPRFLQRAGEERAETDAPDPAEREARTVAAAVAHEPSAPAAVSAARAAAPPPAVPHALPAHLRAPMENALDADFSGVRIHADATSEHLNRALDAKAFTSGEDIFFRPQEYRPREDSGRPLLAHELTHVIQQRAASGAPPAIQCQRMDAGVEAPTVRDAGESDRSGVPAPAPAPTDCPEPLGEFPASTTYILGGLRFDAAYSPTAPEPTLDDFTITHRIHIDFRPFSTRLIREEPRLFGKYRGVRFTPAQRAQFAWSATEIDTFRTDFQTNVQTVWSARHTLVTNEPCFARYRASPIVNIEFVDDPANAHSTVVAYKMPPNTARLRSEVRGGAEARLESRDPSVEERHWTAPSDFVRQIGPFEFDQSSINPPVERGVQEMAAILRPHVDLTQPDDPFPPDSCLSLRGRASSEGSVAYNEELGRRRVIAVRDRLWAVLGVPRPRIWLFIGNEPGERNATTDPRYRRVDASFSRNCPPGGEVPQNVAAHEFGHLIGLGDEYIDERPPAGALPKFEGDRPTHYGDVEAALGTEAADELLVQNSGSIMSQGNTVQRGHYVYFLNAIRRMTGKSWTIE